MFSNINVPHCVIAKFANGAVRPAHVNIKHRLIENKCIRFSIFYGKLIQTHFKE